MTKERQKTHAALLASLRAALAPELGPRSTLDSDKCAQELVQSGRHKRGVRDGEKINRIVTQTTLEMQAS